MVWRQGACHRQCHRPAQRTTREDSGLAVAATPIIISLDGTGCGWLRRPCVASAWHLHPADPARAVRSRRVGRKRFMIRLHPPSSSRNMFVVRLGLWRENLDDSQVDCRARWASVSLSRLRCFHGVARHNGAPNRASHRTWPCGRDQANACAKLPHHINTYLVRPKTFARVSHVLDIFRNGVFARRVVRALRSRCASRQIWAEARSPRPRR